jgi:hypothetical protein
MPDENPILNQEVDGLSIDDLDNANVEHVENEGNGIARRIPLPG